MKTIIVGDMHQKQRSILPIVDNAIRFLGARRIVLLGDYCDDYSPNRDTTDAKKLLEGLEFQADWIDRTRGRGIQVDVLLGNHDMQYLIERQGPGTNLNCIIPVQRLLAQMNVRMAAAVDGWLATHAGLTSQFANVVLEIDTNAARSDQPSYSAESLSEQLNATFDHALSEMFEHANDEELLLLNLCGPGRGGACIPGPYGHRSANSRSSGCRTSTRSSVIRPSIPSASSKSRVSAASDTWPAIRFRPISISAHSAMEASCSPTTRRTRCAP